MANNTQWIKWRKGKPNAEGLWLIEFVSGDYTIVEVEWDQYDEPPFRKYLRINEDGDSEPLKTYKWAKRSFGPINKD